METNVLENFAAALAPLLERQKARQYGIGFKHDSPGDPRETGYLHGPGGVLSMPGVDPVMFHTIAGNASILGQIPAVASTTMYPTFQTLTGVGDDEGEEKDDVCDDAMVAGLLSGCILTSVFGRYERATPEIELNRLGQRNDRNDPMDLQLIGSPIASSGIFNSGTQSAQAPGDVLTNEISALFWERNISLWRQASRQVWVGNPANNSAGGGYKEMTGLSLLVNTGHKDAYTNASCPAMDSLITSFGYQNLAGASSNIVDKFVTVYHQLYRKAELTGILPVRWVVAMRSQMFYELTAVWPCSYLSYRCTTSPGVAGSNLNVNVDANEAIRFRDEMRAGRYLMVDGVRLDVVLDDGIPELTGNDSGGHFPNGCYSSDIYFIPMSVVGGRQVTYMEYFDYTNPSLRAALGDGMTIGRVEGAFLTTMRQKNWCVVWQTKFEPRLIMRTPWLAARIQNVVYCAEIHEPTAFPGDPYFTDPGGEDSRPGPSLYSLWAQ